ncbi:unnamed protein product [Arctogadus glacialis]
MTEELLSLSDLDPPAGHSLNKTPSFSRSASYAQSRCGRSSCDLGVSPQAGVLLLLEPAPDPPPASTEANSTIKTPGHPTNVPIPTLSI